MAYIRLWRLYDYVDRFIILTSSKTISGHDKNFSFYPFEKEIMQFMDKVDIVDVPVNVCNRTRYPTGGEQWCFEKGQRNYAKQYIGVFT